MKNIEIEGMSTEFEVRILDKSEVDIVYNLSIKNSIYYQHHPPMVFTGRWPLYGSYKCGLYL